MAATDTRVMPDGLQTTNSTPRKRYSSLDMVLLRPHNPTRPAGLKDFNSDGSIMSCSLLNDDSNKGAFNWEHVSGALQDASSTYTSKRDGPVKAKRCLSPVKKPQGAPPTALPSHVRLPSINTKSSTHDSNSSAPCSPATPYSSASTPRTPAAADSSAGSFSSCSSLPSSDSYQSLSSTSRVIILGLVDHLNSEDPSINAQAARQLAVLAFSSRLDQDAIVAAQAVPALTRLLRAPCCAEVQETAAAALWGLCRGNPTNQAIVLDSGAMPRLVRLLGSSSKSVQHTAASALRELAQGHARRQQVFADAGAIQMLVHVLKAGCTAGKKVAAEVLEALATSNPGNQQDMVKAGAVPLLVDMLGAQEGPPPAASLNTAHSGGCYPAAGPAGIGSGALLRTSSTGFYSDILNRTYSNPNPAPGMTFSNLNSPNPNSSPNTSSASSIGSQALPEVGVQAAACGALLVLIAGNHVTHSQAAAAGAVPRLKALLQSSSARVRSDAVMALRKLAVKQRKDGQQYRTHLSSVRNVG